MHEQDNFQNAAGFFNSPANAATPAGDQSSQVRRPMNIVPVTICQILQADDNGVKVCGNDVHLLTLVGMIKSVETTSTKIIYTVEDDTGVIPCNLFVDLTVDDSSHPPVVENTYYRVIGSFRTANDHRYVMVLKLMPLSELNELTTHLLEVMHTTVKFQQLSKKKDMQPQTVDNPGLSNSLMNFDMRGTPSMASYGATGGMMNGLTPQQQLVYNSIQSCIENSGIHKNEIASSVRGKVSPKEIDNILEFLSNEGHIYSTIDDEHFKTTESC